MPSEIQQKKNIEWAEKSINPITGCNGPGGVRCVGCYAERIALRFKGINGFPEDDPFKPTWHPERLEQMYNRKKPTTWFWGSMCDWLDDAVLPSWRECSLEAMENTPQHIYITLTKQYANLWKAAYDSPGEVLPDNVILGISVTNREQVWGIEVLRHELAAHKVISFEPLLEDIANIVDLTGIDWIIIGGRSAQSKIADLPAVSSFTPPEDWVWKLVEKAKQSNTAVFMKPNIGFKKRIEEYPFMLKDGKLVFRKDE